MAKYKQMDEGAIRAHYSREEVIQAILDASHDKEVVASYGGTGYGKRPDIITYKDDIVSLVKQGATSFHASEELWNDPLAIKTGMSKKELTQIRKGWDLVLDIDCDYLPFSQIAGNLLIKALKQYGITSVSVKFSGNHGFHIAVPFQAFPKTINGQETRLLFPDAPRAIADFLSQRIQKQLTIDLVDYVTPEDKKHDPFKIDNAVSKIAKLANIAVDELLETQTSPDTQSTRQVLNPFKVVAVDTILITSRHLYRQVYSVNEKSGLVSIPINPDKILQFNKDIAKIENNIFSKFTFLDRSNIVEEEGTQLLAESLDYVGNRDRQLEEEREKERQNRDYSQYVGEKIPEQFFPPQIKAMFGKLSDGKKRAMFILANFLRCVGYNDAEIETKLEEWNKQQEEPLRDSYFQGQMIHFKRDSKAIPPYNFEDTVYKEIVPVELTKTEADLSKKVKNPVAYAKVKFEIYKEAEEKPKKAKGAKKNEGTQKDTDAKPKKHQHTPSKNTSTNTSQKQKGPLQSHEEEN